MRSKQHAAGNPSLRHAASPLWLRAASAFLMVIEWRTEIVHSADAIIRWVT